jgi:hypothetical protein
MWTVYQKEEIGRFSKYKLTTKAFTDFSIEDGCREFSLTGIRATI